MARPRARSLRNVTFDMVKLRTYTDADFGLTQELETDPDVMRELGGPIAKSALPEIHRGRLNDPWWFKIVTEPSGESVGTIGIWDTVHEGETIHETGWMVLPAHQGRGIASAALRLLIDRVRVEPRFLTMHAFPPVSNAPSNALCGKFGFDLVDEVDFIYAGKVLRCNHWARETTLR
jgi:RimJ/RimL family protein N-acetyltransferase